MAESLDHLHEVVLAAARRGPLGENVTDVSIEPALDEDDEAFLRILVDWRPPDHNVDAELEALLEAIEEAIAARDARYASVRFLDAA